MQIIFQHVFKMSAFMIHTCCFEFELCTLHIDYPVSGCVDDNDTLVNAVPLRFSGDAIANCCNNVK